MIKKGAHVCVYVKSANHPDNDHDCEDGVLMGYDHAGLVLCTETGRVVFTPWPAILAVDVDSERDIAV